MTQYALTNPLIGALQKAPEDFTRKDLIQFIEQHHIERITFHYTALDGNLKELRLPLANRLQAERILAEGERLDGSSLFHNLVDVSISDLYVVPVYRSAFLNPFDPRSLDFVCRYLTHDGNLAPFAPDNILNHAYRLFQESTGLQLYALGELEFFLISELDTGAYLTPFQRGYHVGPPFLKSSDTLNEMLHTITRITGNVKYAHSEVGCIPKLDSQIDDLRGKYVEQLEIELSPTPLDVTGDNLVLTRWLTRNIAYRHGCIATFAPKLEEGVAGNGMHIHMELRENGRNVMTDADGNLSSRAKRVIGGLYQYADTLSAFGNTVAASYLRLVPNQEAPTRICWSDLNRSAMIRVPLAWGKTSNLAQKVNPQENQAIEEQNDRQTVELRTPDGSALVHLLLAGIGLAAQWGLT
jgi:glutamine synthetase